MSGREGDDAGRARGGSNTQGDLSARYNVTKNVTLQANLNNLSEKEYDESVVDVGIVYGTPRNFSVTASYRF